jgi:hypothetical protein
VVTTPREGREKKIDGKMTTFVSETVLRLRINHKLANRFQAIRRARGTGMELNFGQYYLLDTHLDVVIAKNVDLEDYAREIGVLRPSEKLRAKGKGEE